MFLSRHKYHIVLFCALLLLSRIVPAQNLPSLPMDPNIRKGTLGCGVTYYMVTDPSQKGYAQLAVVQRDEPLSETAREGLRGRFFARMGIAPTPDGFLTDIDGSTVYRFRDVPFYRPEVLDSMLLYTFARVAASKAEQAVIVSGDIDPVELKKKMDIFSMLVPRMLVKENHQPDYVWEPSPAPVVRFLPGNSASVAVTYAGSRIPFSSMNTAQAIVTDLFGIEFRHLMDHRLRRNFRDAGIPFGDIRFEALRSGDYGGDERYTVRVQVERAHIDPAMRVIAATVGEMDAFGVSEAEYAQSKLVAAPSIWRWAATSPNSETYVNRCIANFLYGANLAPRSETLRYFAAKQVADSTETRLFNQFSDALFTQLANLTLEYTQAPDSLDKDDALFYYNLAYLYGSVIPSGKDYSWFQADTTSLEVSCPRVKVSNEKPEPVSGGTLWTFSNGMRVVFRPMKGSGAFHYALQLNGGLALVDGLQEGEGGYFADMLPLYDCGGLPASSFRDVLAAAGVSMQAEVDVRGMSIRGDAPSGRLPFLLKALLNLANKRSLNVGEFQAYCRNQALRQPEVEDLMYQSLVPGFVYTSNKLPQALTPETCRKAEQYFESRFSRMNDGILIICGDLDENLLKRVLSRYLGGFRTQRGGAGRRGVDFRPLSGTLTRTLPDRTEPGVHLLLDAEYTLTSDHLYTAQIGVGALRSALIRHLAPYGYSPEVTLNCFAHPQERFQLQLDCRPVAADGLPAGESPADPERALTAVRAAVAEAAAFPVSARDLKAWKARLQQNVKDQLGSPEGLVSILLFRYAANKDVTSRYVESINGITPADVQAFLSALAAGGRIEMIVP